MAKDLKINLNYRGSKKFAKVSFPVDPLDAYLDDYYEEQDDAYLDNYYEGDDYEDDYYEQQDYADLDTYYEDALYDNYGEY